MKKKKYNISYFICPECGESFPLPRFQGSQREKGHIKDLYCAFCNKVVKTTEIRSGDCYVNHNGNIVYV